ncbi:MAG: hypothetical protein IKI37_11285 [Oscillospiraceae bacterium]|nr:hypothetical protein [Oscillospiraceae bacterium]
MSITREVPVPITDVGGSPAHGDIQESDTYYSLTEGGAETEIDALPTGAASVNGLQLKRYSDDYTGGENPIVSVPTGYGFWTRTGGEGNDPFTYTFYKNVHVNQASAADESWTGMTDAASD